MEKIKNNDTLGGRIRELRKRKGWTQDELAQIMCIPKCTVSAYENDRVDIKGSVLEELSRILDTTPNYLLGMEQNDKFLNEAVQLLSRISDPTLKNALLVQFRALIK